MMLKILKKNILFLAIMVIAIVLLWFAGKQWFPSIKDIFKPQPVVIDNTPILIKEINELAQLCTITAYDEVVADSVESNLKGIKDGMLGYAQALQMIGPPKKLVIIARGRVVAGVDLKKLTAQDFFIEKDSVSLSLPAAQILDAIMNPSDFEIFIEQGFWNNDAVTAVKIKARSIMVKRALQQQILQKATDRSKTLMENFLRNSGYSKVNVIVKN